MPTAAGSSWRHRTEAFRVNDTVRSQHDYSRFTVPVQGWDERGQISPRPQVPQVGPRTRNKQKEAENRAKVCLATHRFVESARALRPTD